MAVENITHKDKIFAMIIHANEHKEGVSFYTPDDYSLQIGKHIYPSGKVIKAHCHQPVKIERKASLHEALVIEEGKMRITFYTEEGKKIDEKILQKGDMVLLMEGGHGFEFLEPTKMIEIKQGPYIPESKKVLKTTD